MMCYYLNVQFQGQRVNLPYTFGADPGGRSIAGIAGSNPERVMDVCLLRVVLSGRGLCEGTITRPEDSN